MKRGSWDRPRKTRGESQGPVESPLCSCMHSLSHISHPTSTPWVPSVAHSVRTGKIPRSLYTHPASKLHLSVLLPPLLTAYISRPSGHLRVFKVPPSCLHWPLNSLLEFLLYTSPLLPINIYSPTNLVFWYLSLIVFCHQRVNHSVSLAFNAQSIPS